SERSPRRQTPRASCLRRPVPSGIDHDAGRKAASPQLPGARRLIRTLALLGLLLAGRVMAAAAQGTVVRIDDAGPGIGPRILTDVLRRPYSVVPQGVDRFVVARTSENPRTLVVLGRDVVIEGRVQ